MSRTSLNSRVGITNEISRRRVKVYDVDKKELLGTFESITEASDFTGVANGAISSYIKGKIKCHTNKLDRVLAFR